MLYMYYCFAKYVCMCISCWLGGWVSWHINLYRSFKAKSIFIQINSSISKFQFSMSTQFICQCFYFKLFSLVKQF